MCSELRAARESARCEVSEVSGLSAMCGACAQEALARAGAVTLRRVLVFHTELSFEASSVNVAVLYEAEEKPPPMNSIELPMSKVTEPYEESQ